MTVIDKLRHLAEEERHQERGDMRAVNIGVSHDDDALGAQRLLAVMRTDAAAERQHKIVEFLVGAHLVGRGARDIEDLAAQRQDRLRVAVARLFRRAAGAVALDEKDFGALRAVARAIGELAREAQFASRALARHLALLPPALPLLGALGDAVEQNAARRRIGAQPMVEMVAQRGLDEPRRPRPPWAGASRSFVWPWNCGSRRNNDNSIAAPAVTSSPVAAATRRCP